MKTIVLENGLRFRLNTQCPMTMKNYYKWLEMLYRKALWAFRMMMMRLEQ